MRRFIRKLVRAVSTHDPLYYDMHADPEEQFYARIYTHWIERYARQAGIRPPARVLEAGCQTGRLVAPLAGAGFEVTGIDASGFALRRARRHLAAQGVSARLVRGDIRTVCDAHPRWHFDIIVCAEVLYQIPAYREVLASLIRVLRPGGVLLASHRPRFYYLLEALKVYDIIAARAVIRRSEGAYRETRYFNWHTLEALRQLYADLDMRWLGVHAVDRWAWLGGIRPSQLTESQRDALLQMEVSEPMDIGMCGRYALVACQRPEREGSA